MLLFVITVTYSLGLRSRGKFHDLEFVQETRQIAAREGPLKGSGDLLIAILKPEQAIFELSEGAEVIGA